MEYIVSARKYRPMSFDSVVGQTALTTTLKNAVRTGKLAHAYLFCGPRGVGKTTCARIFAKAINCEHPTAEGEACNECESCKAFNEQRSYNIFELDAASNNSVESIKTLMEQTHIPPQVGRYKVFIIDEVHMLSTAAFNAFLKTLEEPPSHVIFILATTEKHKILPTIISRCQIYDFERMSVPDIIEHLKMVAQKEGISYEDEALAVIAEKADGGMRDALSVFDQVASFSQGNITHQKVIEDLNVLDADNYFSMLDLALQNKVSDLMVRLNDILSRGFDGGLLIGGLALHTRNVLMAKDEATLPLLEVSDKQRQRYKEQAQRCPVSFLYKALQLMNRCDVQYKQSSNKRLLVELTLIEVAQLTQPDDDTPAAGRSPKRLKSLFKKLFRSVQPQPAKQVAGAGHSDERANTTDQQAANTPTTAQQTIGATANGGTTHSDTHSNNDRQTTTTKTPKLKLGAVGMSFRNLVEQEKKKPAYVKEPEIENKDERTDFTDEELQLQWRAMCNRMASRSELQSIASRLRNLRPAITNYPNVEVLAESRILFDEINNIKGRIRATLCNSLHNGSIHFTVRMAEQDEIRPMLTRRELFDKLRNENPQIKKLAESLHLDLA